MYLKYNAKYHDDWAWSLAAKGSTDEEIADAFGISKKTLYRWKWKRDENDKYILDENGDKILTSFGEALSEGKAISDAKVEKSLYKRAIGYDYEEEEKRIDVGKDGSSKIGTITTRKRHVPPDTMAIMYWLNNRSRKTGEWSQRQDIVLGMDESIDNDVIIYLPDNGRDKVDPESEDEQA